MEKLINVVLFVLVSLFSMNSQAALSKDARKYDILDLKSGEPGNKKLRQIVRTVVLPVLKHQGVKEVDCLPWTDANRCKQYRKGSWKDRRCQAELAKARCRAVGNVLHPVGIKVRPIEGGEERSIKSGKYRGVSLFWKNAYCTASDLRRAVKIRREFDRKRISKSRVSLVPEDDIAKDPVRLVMKLRASRTRSGVMKPAEERICLAMVDGDGGRVVKRFCPAGTRREGRVCVRTKVKVVEKPLDPCPKGSSRVGRVCVRDEKPCPKGSTRIDGVCIADPEEDECPVGTEMLNGVCELKCQKGEHRVDGKCVAKGKVSWPDLSFGLALGGGILSFCPALTEHKVQVTGEAFVGIGKYFRIFAGFQSASSVTGLDPNNGDTLATRIPLLVFGGEAFVLIKDRFEVGVRASVMAMMEGDFRANSIGGFVGYKFTDNVSVKFVGQAVIFDDFAVNDPEATAESSMTWHFAAMLAYTF